MRKIRELLRLRWGEGLSQAAVARSLSVASSTVWECVNRAKTAGLSWPLPRDLDDASLEALLYCSGGGQEIERAKPDFGAIHKELGKRHVTLQLLWQEYKQAHPEDGYQYSRFCDLYRQYRSQLDVALRQEHRAGEKLFIDYAGPGIEIVDPETGEIRRAELFLASLGASHYTYAEVTESQQLEDWIGSHVRAFEFFGGVTEILVPDNLKSGVRQPCRYEPDVNPTYHDLAVHYDTVVIPARPYKAKDKAKVEGAVLIAERWILAALRNHRFFSLAQANEAVQEKLEEFNRRRFQKLDTNRAERFEELDRPALRPLPASPFELTRWSKKRVTRDYHVEVSGHFYSVPYQLVGHLVEIRETERTVEVLLKGKRVASHPRGEKPQSATTIKDHMPRAHREHLEWTPSRLLQWAEETGPSVARLVALLLERARHPEQAYRSCLGLLRLGRRYGTGRLEAACHRALSMGACSYKSVCSILATKLDQESPAREEASVPSEWPLEHVNVRGPDYYQ